MPLSKRAFHPEREPLRDHAGLELQRSHVNAPLSFLNPTHAVFKPTEKYASEGDTKRTERAEGEEAPAETDEGLEKQQQPQPPAPQSRAGADQVQYLWRSRDNRKGRHALQVRYHDEEDQTKPRYEAPRKTSEFRSVLQGIWRMCSVFPYWDVSYLVASIFSFGSVIWVINAFFVWLPLEDPSSEFPHESFTGGGVTAFIGATVFEIGSVLLILEAVNENTAGCFGWALEQVLREETAEAITVVKPASQDKCRHHHADRRIFLGSGRRRGHASWTTVDAAGDRTFTWFPSWAELQTHYLHELGFLASFAQLIGATIFWIAGFTGLPGIANHMSQRVTNGVFWVPQIVGGSFFIISGLLFTIETQKKWYIPAPAVLGWHIGAWNFIGGIGFTLCGALGPATANSGVEYQSSLATFWGSWAFLIGSVIQWYESLDKYPVEEMKDKTGGKAVGLDEIGKDELARKEGG
ncbi:integral membrane protein [Paecilomyces variotii No. 5]|uniref:Integral membrane protein n=1 Tax=Byssochlamys spectabilis (strain No. 5 / NBRC 109023) TaxID=1356009 RepID=V5I596_BYSSN|nr:integral membrane protein [Paecilomyces variotii No. 5]